MDYSGERFIPNFDGPQIEAEHVHRYKVIGDYLEDLHVLDAGCGTGYGSFMLSQSAKTVTGIDNSSETIDWCRENYGFQKNLSFLQGSLEKLPFENEEFDCVVCLEVIEHVDKDIQQAFLKEAKRVLKPNGFLIMSTPNKLVYTDKSGYKNPFHVSEFYREEFESYLGKEFPTVFIFDQLLHSVSIIQSQSNAQSKTRMYSNSDIEPVGKYMIAVCGSKHEEIAKMNLSSVYQYDNPGSLYVSTLYTSLNGSPYNPQISQSSSLIINEENNFSITFDVSQYTGISNFRFDPVENHFCICNINEVLSDGEIESVSPLNALEYYRIGFVFLNTDPQFEIKGNFDNAKYVTIKGYFKTMNHNQIDQFVNGFYQRLLNGNKDTVSVKNLSQIADQVNMKVDEMKVALTSDMNLLIANQKNESEQMFNAQRNEQRELIGKIQSLILEETELLNSVISKVDTQESKLQTLHEILTKRRGITSLLQKFKK